MAMVDIAYYHSSGPVSLQNISVRQNIPLRYLEQIFSKLRKEGLVTSVRGPGGGYVPSKAIKDILLSDVVLAAEGSFKMTRCGPGMKCNNFGTKCMTHDLWKGLSGAIFDYFNGISVADIINNKVLV